MVERQREERDRERGGKGGRERRSEERDREREGESG